MVLLRKNVLERKYVNMKVLLIGGTGILSSDTTRLCIDRGYEVFLFNRGSRNNFTGDNLHYLIGDINKTDTAKEILRDHYFDVVIDYITYGVSTLKSRIELFKNRCRQYIFISSTAVFKNTDCVITEDSEKGNDNWNYAVNKLLCEKYLINHAVSLGFYYTIVRPCITYSDTRVPFPVVTKKYYWTLLDRIYNDKPILVCDDGEAKLTLTHTMDFAVGITGLFLNENAYNQDFNIVGDTVGTWNDIVSVLEEYTNKKAHVIYVDSKTLGNAFLTQRTELICDKSHSHIFDNGKIKKAVPEFRTLWNLHDGLFHTLDYMHSHADIQKIDADWNNTVDVLSAKFCADGEYTASVRQRMIYFMQENRYLSSASVKLLNNKLYALYVRFVYR